MIRSPSGYAPKQTPDDPAGAGKAPRTRGTASTPAPTGSRRVKRPPRHRP